MNAIDWLQRNAPGFRELSEEERNAIMQFSLLWSLLEATALDTHGNAKAIVETSKKWASGGLLTPETFRQELIYFQNRYCADGEFTYRFAHLHLRPADKPDLVARVLRNEGADLSEIAAALLIVVYRLRNNLFHGVKWVYEIRGQLDNFNQANSILMRAIELQEKLPAAT